MLNASVVITTYNGKKQIQACLLSLNHQILKQDESFNVVVVDDGSDDGTDEVIGKLRLNYDCKYLYKERTPTSSRAAARNMGIRHCDGDIIIFLDGDQIVGPTFIQEHLRSHRWNRDIVVVGLRNYLSPGTIDLGKLARSFSPDNLPPVQKSDGRCQVFARFSENLGFIRTAWHLGYSCNVSVRKAHLDRVGYFNEGFIGWGLEDCELMFRLCQAGLRMVLNKHALTYHQYHESAWNESKYQQWYENLKYFISLHPQPEVSLQILLDSFFDPKKRQQPWIDYYERFELSVRKHKNEPVWEREKICYLVNSNQRAITEIVAEIAKHSPEQIVVVIDDAVHSDLDVVIQTLEEAPWLQYFSVPDEERKIHLLNHFVRNVPKLHL
jgi:glycosyltransferase involved in cell wall biosynthesis